jgi:hypothetical protein
MIVGHEHQQVGTIGSSARHRLLQDIPAHKLADAAEIPVQQYDIARQRRKSTLSVSMLHVVLTPPNLRPPHDAGSPSRYALPHA